MRITGTPIERAILYSNENERERAGGHSGDSCRVQVRSLRTLLRGVEKILVFHKRVGLHLYLRRLRHPVCMYPEEVGR